VGPFEEEVCGCRVVKKRAKKVTVKKRVGGHGMFYHTTTTTTNTTTHHNDVSRLDKAVHDSSKGFPLRLKHLCGNVFVCCTKHKKKKQYTIRCQK
jgi:hypothetical protein